VKRAFPVDRASQDPLEREAQEGKLVSKDHLERAELRAKSVFKAFKVLVDLKGKLVLRESLVRTDLRALWDYKVPLAPEVLKAPKGILELPVHPDPWAYKE